MLNDLASLSLAAMDVQHGVIASILAYRSQETPDPGLSAGGTTQAVRKDAAVCI
jgi:hypothetical protein